MQNKYRKIKVLNVAGGLSAEGIGVFLMNTFKNIDHDKYDYSISLATKYKQLYEDEIISQGCKVYRTFEIGDGFKGKIKHFINLYRLLKKERFDVIHSHMDFFNGFNMMVAFFAAVPLRISHAHTSNNNKISSKKSFYYGVMRSLIKLFSNAKIGCSEEATKYVNGSGQVLLNGIDTKLFSSSNRLPEDLIIDHNKINIVTVGNINEPKNPYFIKDIVKSLQQKNVDFHFFWIGSSSALKKQVEKECEKESLLDYISFLGVRKDVRFILPSMDIFILPSKYEGLPISLIEAQFSGLQCLISENVPNAVNIGLCKKINLEEGAEEWANQIVLMSHSTKNKMSLNSLLAEKFDIHKTTKELEKVYSTNFDNCI